MLQTRAMMIGLAFSSLPLAMAADRRAVPVEDRAGKLKSFPCSACHKNFSSQSATTKEHRSLVFRHLKEEKKCLLCHAQHAPDKLVLLDGHQLSFSASPQLCGQCHGPIYIDWKEGIHGKRLAKGTAADEKLVCVSCHDPHSPKFKKMQALPAPHRPKLGVEKKESDEH